MNGSQKNKRLLELGVIFFWASEYCHAPYFTPYLQSLHIGAAMIGLIVGCYGFTQLLVRIPLGFLTDMTGSYKAVIVSGLFFTTLSSFGLWLFTDVRLIFLFRVFAGFAAATWIATSVAYMGFYSAEEGVQATATLNGLNSGGKLLAFVLGFVAARMVNYRTTLFLSFAAGLIGLVFVLFLDRFEPVWKPVSVRNIIGCLQNRRIVAAAALAGINMMVMHATVYSFTSTFAETLGAGAWMLSLLSIVFTLTQIFSVGLLKIRWVQQAQPAKLLSIGFLFACIYLLILAFAGNVYLILAGQILAGLANAASNSLLMSECVKSVPPGEKTIAMGVFQAIYSIGMTAGPVFLGRMLEMSGIAASCCMLAAFPLAAALLVSSASQGGKVNGI